MNLDKANGFQLFCKFWTSSREALGKGVSGEVGGGVKVAIRHPLRNVYLNPCSVKWEKKVVFKLLGSLK